MMALKVAAASALVFGASAHQHIVLLGSGFSGVDKVELKKTASGSWEPTKFAPNPSFAYLVAVEPSEILGVRVIKGDDVFEQEQVIPDCHKGCMRAWTLKGSSGNGPSMIGFQTSVRHQDMFKEFYGKVKAKGDDLTQLKEDELLDFWKEIRQEHKGFELNVFADGLTNHVKKKFVLTFEGKETQKDIQAGGAVFSAWSIPKVKGDIKMFIDGTEVGSLHIDKVGMYPTTLTVEGKNVNVYVMANTVHKRMENIWKTVHGQSTAASDLYWDKSQMSWSQPNLDNVFQTVLKEEHLADTFESDSDTPSSSWKIIVVIVLITIVLGIAVWWSMGCCKKEEDESDSDEPQTANELEFKDIKEDV